MTCETHNLKPVFSIFKKDNPSEHFLHQTLYVLICGDGLIFIQQETTTQSVGVPT